MLGCCKKDTLRGGCCSMAQQPEEENLLADEGAPGAAPEEGVELQTVKLEEMAPVVRGPGHSVWRRR